jgi:serine/threonine protein kinase
MVKIGQTIAGRYRIKNSSAEDDSLSIFLAQDRVLACPVTLKILSSTQPSAVSEFLQEAQIAASLKHPNILETYDFGQYKDETYMVAAYPEEGSLADLLSLPAITGLALTPSLNYFVQILAGINYAHSQQMAHGNLTPQKILFIEGRIVISDFGQTNIPIDAIAETYLAPESWNGESSTASDIYTLGLILYEMLAGKPAFTPSQGHIRQQHLEQPIPNLLILRPDLPAGIQTFLNILTSKNPQERPAAKDILQLLETLVPSVLLPSYFEMVAKAEPATTSAVNVKQVKSVTANPKTQNLFLTKIKYSQKSSLIPLGLLMLVLAFGLLTLKLAQPVTKNESLLPPSLNTPTVLRVIDNSQNPSPFTAANPPVHSTITVLSASSSSLNLGSKFKPVVSYNIGDSPISLAAADFDGNGKTDLGVIDNSGKDISILLNKGDGSFTTASNYAIGSYPEKMSLVYVAAGDFNRDGRPDLAVADLNRTIHILLNRGDKGFDAVANYSLEATATSLVVADFNGDGFLDIVANKRGSTASILLGNGDGSFKKPASFGVANNAISIATGDLNGDGKPDLVIASNTNNGLVGVILGNGNGTFQATQTYKVDNYPAQVAVADLNGDDKPDIVIANQQSANISILLNKGDGIFSAATNYLVGLGSKFVEVGDFNGDGKPDIAITNAANNNISVLLNQAANK